MKKSGDTFEIRKSLQQMLPKNRVDPTTQLEKLFEIIPDCLRGLRRPSEDSRYLHVGRQAVAELFRHASVLNKFDFWDDLDCPQKWEMSVAESERSSRARMIAEMRSLLSSDDLGMDDLVGAMKVVSDVFRSMAILFRWGRLSDDDVADISLGDLHYQKYRCAAILPTVVRLLDRVWEPLLLELNDHQHRRRSQRAHAG